jgi:hypothetical protein
VLSSLEGVILVSRAAKSVAPIEQAAKLVLQIVRAKVTKP